MHPHLHMQLARTIIDERLRDAQARHRNGHMRQRQSLAATASHTVTHGQSVSDRSRVIAKARVKTTRTHAAKGQP